MADLGTNLNSYMASVRCEVSFLSYIIFFRIYIAMLVFNKNKKKEKHC